MTDKELQDLIGLKKYEQPSEEYFDEFLVEFKERQRSEMLKTSARGLLIERMRAWFSELGSIRWVLGGGAAYAAVALMLSMRSSDDLESPVQASTYAKVTEQTEGSVDLPLVGEAHGAGIVPLSMVFTSPVDFSSPSPAFSEEERFF